MSHRMVEAGAQRDSGCSGTASQRQAGSQPEAAAPPGVLPGREPKANGDGLSGTLGPLPDLNAAHVSSREVI